jgi:hypothetical protein
VSQIKVGVIGKRIADAVQKQPNMTLTGVAGVPIEDILFTLSLGFLWSNTYEYATLIHPIDASQTAVVEETVDHRR